MVVNSVRYRFQVPFRAPARAAFEWCVDFRPSDVDLHPRFGRRAVHHLSADAFVLTDTTRPKGQLRRIRRLVRIDPSTMSWTNTHISGPFLHSQFWYQIVSDGPRRCHLAFDGLWLPRSPRALPATAIQRLAAAERANDAGMWRREFTPALESDIAGTPARPPTRS